MINMDAYAEMFLWNREIDQLVRVLQRLEPFSIRPKQEMKAYEVRLEEIRTQLNADFADAMVRRERAHETSHWRQRTV